MAPCYFTESKLFWYSWKFSFILTGTHKLLRHESAWTTLISQSMHMYIWLMAWMWWKHVKHLWSFCVWWAAGSCWSKCTSQAHCICLILVGSAGRFYQSHWLLIWCITLYLHHLSNQLTQMLKCTTAPMSLHTWWARARAVLNVSFMVLHNVLQSYTHGICCLCVGSLITMTVWQIELSAVQRIILWPSGEVQKYCWSPQFCAQVFKTRLAFGY